MIVAIDDDETREAMLARARFLARKDEWKREEMRKDEEKMREDGDKKTEEAKRQGLVGKWLVVGRRGKR